MFLEFMGEGHEEVTQSEFPVREVSTGRGRRGISRDVRRGEAILLCQHMLIMLINGRRLVDDGDLGAQAAKGPAEAGTALGAQRGEVVAEGALLLVAVARGDETNVGIAVARVPQGEDEGMGRIERERRRGEGDRIRGGGGRARRPRGRGGRCIRRCCRMLGLLVELA